MGKKAGEETSGLSTRGAVLSGVAVVAILSAALFTGAFLVPFLRTRAAMKGFQKYLAQARAFGSVSQEEAKDYLLSRFKSLDRARPQLKLYVRLPDSIAPYRKHAATLLGYCGEPAVDALIDALNDRNATVRRHAAWGLWTLGPDGSEAIPALIQALEDSEPVVRQAACGALGRIGPQAEAAVPKLIRLFGDKFPDDGPGRFPTSDYAVSALGGIGAPAVPALVNILQGSDVDMRICAAEALRRMGPEAQDAVPSLEKLLGDKDRDVCWIAARALGGIGPAAKGAVPALLEAFEHKDNGTRRVVAEALGELGPSARKAVSVLEKALRDNNEDWDVGIAAAETLVKLSPHVEDAMLASARALDDNDQLILIYGTNMLHQMRPAAVPAFGKALAHEKWEIRTFAAWALGEIGSPAKSFEAALREMLADREPKVQYRAAATLFKITGEAEKTLPIFLRALGDWDRNWQSWATERIGEMGSAAKDAVPVLEKVLMGEEPWIRCKAAAALFKVTGEPGKSLPVFLRALDSKESSLREWAAERVGEIGPAAEDAVPALEKLLKGESYDGRVVAAEALGKIGSAARVAVPTLENALRTDAEDIRCAAALALGKISPASQGTVLALMKTLKNQDRDVRTAAAKALGQIGLLAGKAAPALERALEDKDWFVRQAAAEALKKIRGGAKPEPTPSGDAP